MVQAMRKRRNSKVSFDPVATEIPNVIAKPKTSSTEPDVPAAISKKQRSKLSFARYFTMALLVMVLALQFGIAYQLSIQVESTNARFDVIEKQLKSEEVEVTSKDSEVVLGSEYHSYEIPNDVNEAFTYDDFVTKFNCKPLHVVLEVILVNERTLS
jgi:cell division protein FtsL